MLNTLVQTQQFQCTLREIMIFFTNKFQLCNQKNKNRRDVYHTETYYHNFYGNTYPKSPVCACVWSREIIVLDTHGMDVYIGAYVRQYILIKSR